MRDEFFWLLTWLILVIGAIGITWLLVAGSVRRTEFFVNGGYVEQTLQGSDLKAWVKPCEKE